MNISRKKFLKMTLSGSVYTLFGGVNLLPEQWFDGGAKLLTLQRQSLLMGSVASFQVIASSKSDGYEAIRKAEDEFRRLDQIFSMYKTGSEMMRLAAQSGEQPLRLSEDALKLLQKAKHFYKATNGSFDITIEPLMRRWGFRKGDEATITPPADKELKKLEHLIGSDKLIIENKSARLKNTRMAIDTGGIAGGYALDKAMEVMKKSNIAAAFINFSGDIHCFGEVGNRKGWPVQIYNPSAGEPLFDEIILQNKALSTSGAYQNRRGNSTHSWGHLMLPSSERPVEPVASMTAIHTSAVKADAWSTAAYVGAKPPPDVRTVVIPP